jgi:tetratricopeptide (TPR) repeat protein
MSADHGVESKIADWFSAVELGYWQSDVEQKKNCKILLNLCLHNKHPLLGYAYLLYGRTHMVMGDLVRAKAIIDKGIKHCQQSNDKKHLLLGLLWLGLVLDKLKKHQSAFQCWYDCLIQALAQSDLEIAVEAYLNIGLLYKTAELTEECAAMMLASFSMSENIDNKKLIAKSGIFLSDFLLESHDFSAALSIIARAELDVILYSDVTWIVQLCKNKAVCYWKTGQIEAAIENYESGIIMAKKFAMAWAYIHIALSYTDFLIERKEYEKADLLLNDVLPCFEVYPDQELQLAWLRIRYLVSKGLSNFQDALQFLKKSHFSALALNCTERQAGISLALKNKLKHKYALLQREFRKFERVVDAPSVRMSVRQVLDFKERCEYRFGTGRIIELIVTPEKKLIEQRALLVVSDYCSNKDIWLNAGNGHYYIFPADSAKSLHEFSLALSKAIESQPWARLNIKNVIARTRILLINEEIINRVNQLIQRGWHDAG